MDIDMKWLDSLSCESYTRDSFAVLSHIWRCSSFVLPWLQEYVQKLKPQLMEVGL